MADEHAAGAAPKGKRRPCKGCGADLEFAVGTTELVCPYCGARQEIGASDKVVREHNYHEALGKAGEAVQSGTMLASKCGGCGAEVTRDASIAGDKCPYCGTGMTTPPVAQNAISPHALLPFKVSAQEARAAFHAWIRSLWFAPGVVKQLAGHERSLQGVYVPFWTYDCRTVTTYTGSKGVDYWTTESYTTTENGRTVHKTRQVRKTRWYPASGTVRNTFDDILILASRNLPKDKADALEPWDLQDVAPYDEAFLAGFRTERYQVNIEEGFAEACRRMEGPIEQTIRGDIGGDHQRISAYNVSHHDITYKHILLPVWISSYQYAGKVYRFLVNARTSEVQGERPWSAWKIAFAVIAGLAVAAAVIGLVCMSPQGR